MNSTSRCGEEGRYGLVPCNEVGGFHVADCSLPCAMHHQPFPCQTSAVQFGLKSPFR